MNRVSERGAWMVAGYVSLHPALSSSTPRSLHSTRGSVLFTLVPPTRFTRDRREWSEGNPRDTTKGTREGSGKGTCEPTWTRDDEAVRRVLSLVTHVGSRRIPLTHYSRPSPLIRSPEACRERSERHPTEAFGRRGGREPSERTTLRIVIKILMLMAKIQSQEPLRDIIIRILITIHIILLLRIYYLLLYSSRSSTRVTK